MNILGKGFMYTVTDNGDGTVKKIPMAPGNTTAEKEEESLKLHKQYLGSFVPKTDIHKYGKESFSINQKLIVGSPVDLEVDFTNEEIKKLLTLGANMQQNHKVLFDVFGMQGMIRLFNYYFAGTLIKNMSDCLLPVSANYLRIKHNLPETVLLKMNNENGSPFIAHNILKDDKGEFHFIDTDGRSLDLFHPLNLLGRWITQKALNDLKNKKD